MNAQQRVISSAMIYSPATFLSRLPRWHSGKGSACQCRRYRRLGFNPWVGKIPWRRKWQSTPGLLPGKFHGQGSWQAVVCGVAKSRSPLSDWTELTSLSISTLSQFCKDVLGKAQTFRAISRWAVECWGHSCHSHWWMNFDFELLSKTLNVKVTKQ